VRRLWLLLLLGHLLGEQPLGFLGTVAALPCDLPQEGCQFFILTNGSGAGQGILGPFGKRLVPLSIFYQGVLCVVHPGFTSAHRRFCVNYVLNTHSWTRALYYPRIGQCQHAAVGGLRRFSSPTHLLSDLRWTCADHKSGV
jgi:hypothetical protein